MSDLTEGPKIIFIDALVWNAAVAMPKFSALFFYHRIFQRTHQWFFIALWIAGFLNVLWLIGAELSTVFQCRPVRAVYDITVKGHCFPQWKWQLATTVPSVIIDVFILLIPLPLLATLQVSKKRKLLLISVFICGYW